MAGRKEVELKYGLQDRSEYERLCTSLGSPERELEQVNHYFQSADGKIPGPSGVIRIRTEGDKAVFTIKLGGRLDKGLAIAREFEEAWPGPCDKLPPPADELWRVGHAGMNLLAQSHGHGFPLVCLGRMANRRRFYRIENDLILEIDASRYPDMWEDYEVELETESPDRDRKRLLNLLDFSGVKYFPQKETKYQRFLRHS